ncbi:septal ring lytic transglycosylase RlpA family protein [Desulfohalovibrio reitneri]|uniref:septal ring lytic transglycosylase RlpA family protein n=1 Tax=Desulfohalovibrio reitneri TaxID=1307759 RepID=UPI0004A6FC80|nr:septal ring lytic transglycosylase RlpA family protein [Desulfohalovibrio reitneri]
MPRTASLACICLLALVLLAGCSSHRAGRPGVSGQAPAPTETGKTPATQRPYTVFGASYTPMPTADGYVQEGVASWYGRKFHGNPTANGETYDMYAFTAAHRVLPMGTRLRVLNKDNGREVLVRVNDRGPFVDTRKRIIDLSYAAARKLGMDKTGLARVRLSTVGSVAGATRNDLRGEFYVQVGAFTVKENALRLASALRGDGYRGTRVQRAEVEGRTFWRVQAGVFNSLSAALKGRRGLTGEHPRAFILAGR